MRSLLNLLAAASCGCCAAQAASVGGVVLDSGSGRPLARTMVTLKPIEQNGKPISARADRGGQFSLVVNAGKYMLVAVREGFAPYRYGQKEWQSAPRPLSVEQDDRLMIEIHMHRFGAIQGTVLDENDIGIPRQRVLVYPVKMPLEIADTATTDDRGMFRVHGLPPGSYYLRTAAKELEDGSGLLPTFHRQTMLREEAVTVAVALDQETENVEVRPEPGNLVKISGKVAGLVKPARATLSLISDAGRVQTTSDEEDHFEFTAIAPGRYDLFAEGNPPGLAYFAPLVVDKDEEDVHAGLSQWPVLRFQAQDEKGVVDAGKVKLSARRKDLDGPGAVKVLKTSDFGIPLSPGTWEISIEPPAGEYAREMWGPGSHRGDRADGWNEIKLPGNGVLFKLSSHPASMHGTVVDADKNPTPGAPVHLEALNADTGERIGELHQALTDSKGQYRFRDLPPGSYRVLSSFEYDKPDSATMQSAGARQVTLSKDKDSEQDLELYVR